MSSRQYKSIPLNPLVGSYAGATWLSHRRSSLNHPGTGYFLLVLQSSGDLSPSPRGLWSRPLVSTWGPLPWVGLSPFLLARLHSYNTSVVLHAGGSLLYCPGGERRVPSLFSWALRATAPRRWTLLGLSPLRESLQNGGSSSLPWLRTSLGGAASQLDDVGGVDVDDSSRGHVHAGGYIWAPQPWPGGSGGLVHLPRGGTTA